ncbi:PREDICTED: E3 ubiquitin-protein ligase UPL1-like isoform X2 [Lupinus angustifolius]|uniref:E3 ubiquitin-protein ligase UPL1-like isoform X1 n=1 Tax=Lupinus angustifolius TaxID=3871 RepID=UPI00092E6821|nr:PREDICTED: E3 ubiquitin-protein ligase UPL1-like isoform X1 [Lupinus angustifolius]XP_019414795.1 PREDICTED: E3 ubiquitin-protein ligase UPL1-like isoform X2 [Lupinus angustifolius]
MTTLRSSWPSRLRQLLSNEGTIAPSIKLTSEPPPKIKTFIDKVIQCPLQDIARPLSDFQWEYSKGNFHHWMPLFLHFDTYFKTYLSCRNDLTLSDNLEDDTPLPKHAILQILRAMQIILENCPNKSSFDGLEHFKLLLASTDPEILIATLETLAALVKINPSKLHGSAKMVGCGSVNNYLLSLAQGWGSKEEGLGLYSCIMTNEKAQDESLCLFPSDVDNSCDQSNYRIGSTLYFELYGPSAQSKEHSVDTVSSSLRVIHMADMHLRKEDELSFLKQCIEQYSVPPDLRFSLLTRIRYACSFRSLRISRLYSRICLLAFIVLVQSSDAHDELVSFFANEPEYTNELVRVVRSEETISGSIRTIAMLALGAQLAAHTSSHERARVLNGSSMTFAGGNHMILLNVLQKAILSLKSSNDPSSLAFVEALLQFYLLHVVSTSSSGSSIRGSGMVPTFLPLLEDSDPAHIHLVCSAVKTLQKHMDYSSSAVSLFKELGGSELLAQRLQLEVHRVIGLVGENDNVMLTGESTRNCTDQLYPQKRLIKVSLKALGSATYVPTNSSRSQHSQDSSLPATIALIFRNVDKFGGDIYYSAVTVMSEIIHKDPTGFAALHEMGLPDAFLSSVVSGVLPSSKALTCIPNGLGAICLNAKGLEIVRETSSLRFLVDIFTSKKYVLAMNEAIIPLANSVEELLRHVSSLRSTGVDIIIEIIHKIASFGDGNDTGSSGKADEGSAMNTDSGEKESENHYCDVGTVSSSSEGISDEHFVQLCIFHLMVLVHQSMESSETCRLFVEKSGIEALLKLLLLRPTIAQSSDGMSIALHSTMVFKGFAQHHSAPLARAFCSSLRQHLKKALNGFGASSRPALLDPRMTTDRSIFSSLFSVEFLLFLAASKDNRWVTALLTEFGAGSKDVLEDIGHVHREVLWQLALLENKKPDYEDDGACSAANSQQAEVDANETEEQRLNSFRQLLDPLRRRTSGWSIESQFFDLINMYRGLGRATGSQHRSSIVGPSNTWLDSSNNFHHSGSSEASGDIDKKDSVKRRTYYTSCCDMVRSLSFHTIHLFQELGKVMLLPSRRRDDMMNVSPASESVASTFAHIALDYMNFGGHEISLGTETSISTKFRYFGKVIDFMDNIVMERPDSCNPVLLNSLYGHGVIQSVLTTFEATCQLLFPFNQIPASPMETDDGSAKHYDKEDAHYSSINASLASYGKFMDHLVTSSFILSPLTKHLLVQPLTSGIIPFPRDAEMFVKVLQSMVLKVVLPVWTHPQLVDCSYEFISTIISIIRHVYSGVEVNNVSSSSGVHIARPPPNETTISTIVEMGFSSSRAEEALRQVGSNSVELAMEWLFSHPESEDTEEDDELARALAMSLGKSDSDTEDGIANDNAQQLEEEMVQLPPIDELLSICTKLLQKETLAFPVRDLLVMICSQNVGQCRSIVVTYIVDQIKECGLVSSNGNYTVLAALFHVLALILNDDSVAREDASKSGLIKIASDLLYQWDSCLDRRGKLEVPKWVTTAFFALDRLLQVDQKLNSEVTEQLKKEVVNSQQTSITIDEDKLHKLQSVLGLPSKYADIHEQKRLIEVAYSCMKNQLPSDTMHSILLLCSNLTRNHSVALTFFYAGGINLLLSLPTSSLFPGFDNVAASIVRHVLEDPQTLHQAMESEIKHSLAVPSNRHPNGRVNPRNFLLNLASVISRDPIIFMQAAKTVCQVEMVGERPYIVLLKDRDKYKAKEKEREKDKSLEKGKAQNNDGKVGLGNTNTEASGNGHGKIHDSKSVKCHKKPVQSFINVIELLLESICNFIVPPLKDDIGSNVLPGTPTSSAMDIDISIDKGKGKAVATTSEGNETSNQEASASLAKIVFVLKLLTETLLMYSSSVHVLLRRDAEISSTKSTHQKSNADLSTRGIFYHILHNFLPYSRKLKKDKKVDGDWRQKLASRANQFVVATSVRSTEARRRVFTEISHIINEFVDSCNGFKPLGNEIQVFVDLLNDVLSARTPAGSSISAEASATFMDAGLVKSFTRTLEVLDLDHVDSSKVATGIIKALELVTKESVHSVDSGVCKGTKPSDLSQPGRTDNVGDMSQSMETTSQSNIDSLQVDLVGSYNAIQSYGGSVAVTDDMEHDQDFDGGFAPANDDEYMHETAGARGLDNGIENVGLQFEIQPHGQENHDDDEDDMSGDEEDEDDEERNGLEEDEVHHMPHHDTDQDDHEMDDDDDFDEAMEEEDDEDDEDEVILRLEEGVNGINVFDHIEVFGRDNSFPNEAHHAMPVEVFGSRRPGRTTSIYSLLGRTGDTATPSRHPLLVGPSSSFHLPTGQSDNILENSSSLDNIFRSLRNGRHGHRMNLWSDNNQQSSGPNTGVLPQGLEELIVSQLRQLTPEKSSDNNIAEEGPHSKVDVSQMQDPGDSRLDVTVESNAVEEGGMVTRLSIDNNNDTADIRLAGNGSLPVDVPSTHSQTVEMQFEHTDAVIRDVEAVSQESGGSGATFGESLRSLDVEIGSADGHDDGGERHVTADRIAGDSQAARTRRANTPFGHSSPVGGRDASLHSVTEVSENSSRDADQNGPEVDHQVNSDAGSGAIDRAFLDALPDELRAEVLSAQQGQVAQPSNAESQNTGDIDPEFLAALPPDIRAEVLAQQRAQRLHQSQELEGQPVEMDTVSIIATFPSEIREEVLLTSSDAVLANLTPALVAEANMLRERFAHRYSRTLFNSRGRRGETSRRNEGIIGLDGAGGSISSRRSGGAKVVEADGAPLVDTKALHAMIRLFRIVQPLYKGQLQRLLLNLCAHSETRTSLVKILMDLLILDVRKPSSYFNKVEPPYRLYGCQNNVMYSRPQSFDGVPPLLSRRILETLTYLARNHPYVAKNLLQFRLHHLASREPNNADVALGKAVMVVEDEENIGENIEGCVSITILLSLLKRPLYLRSIAHLEQLLNLLDVIIDSAGSKSSSSNKSQISTELESAPQTSVMEADVNTDSVVISHGLDASPKVDDSSKPTSSGNKESETEQVLSNLPQAELRLLCSLLALEGLSDNAYGIVAEVMKKLVAIAPTHCQLFVTELAAAVQKLTSSAKDELRVFSETIESLLSTTSSDGAAILRVLQALSSLLTSLTEKESDGITLNLSEVWEINLALEPLWHELSCCICKIESYSESGSELLTPSRTLVSKPSGVMSPLPAGSQNILPYIESFFVVCEKLHPAQSGAAQGSSVPVTSDVEEASTSATQQKTSGPAVKVDEKQSAFVKFSEKHRKLLNTFIRQNPGLLEKSFSLMLKVPRFIDFDNKRSHFRSKIKHQHDHHHSTLRIPVRRAYVLEDSYNQLRMRPAQDLKGRLNVHFRGEEGIDAGGLTREWYQLLSRVIFDKGALLFTTVGNELTFQPNPNSVYQTEHLSYFKFVGRVVGKALFDGQLLDVHFTRSFYKHILGAKVTYHDIEAIDPDYFKNLKWMLENDISDVLDLTFSIDADEEKLILYERAEVTDYELIPGGRNIKVTEENKNQYVDLVAEHRLTTAIRPQINAFLEGFSELIPRELISIFNDKELELLISGLPEIDLDDLRANTEYSGYSVASPVIQWFWEVVQGLSKEDKARLLQFVTGTSKVPLEGFSALQGISGSQKFQIHKAYGSPDHLPSAHTCFNQLDLPEYPSKQHLEDRLLLAIHEANEGFGFG